jgi:ribonuclease BN (tRNA processing enzyme)
VFRSFVPWHHQSVVDRSAGDARGDRGRGRTEAAFGGSRSLKEWSTGRAWPAIHAGDGPVSFSLVWNGYKVIFGGDTFPNTWFVKYAKDADIVIHEAMLTADQLRRFYNQPPSRTIMMNTDIHTSAQAFGKVISMIQPKHAIAYHFFNEEGTRYGIYDGIRETYDGPLSGAAFWVYPEMLRGGTDFPYPNTFSRIIPLR